MRQKQLIPLVAYETLSIDDYIFQMATVNY